MSANSENNDTNASDYQMSLKNYGLIISVHKTIELLIFTYCNEITLYGDTVTNLQIFKQEHI